MPELILSLRERELARFAIVAARTTLGRDPGNDVVIDNVGISRLHATIEVVGDSFVLRDCESENGLTLNGEPCREGRLVHGDMIGLNKFLVRFSNETLEDPANLPARAEPVSEGRPRDVQRTMHVDREAAQALVDSARRQIEIARQRAQNGQSPGSAEAPAAAEASRRGTDSLGWEEAEGSGVSLPTFVGAVVLGGALIAGLLWVVF